MSRFIIDQKLLNKKELPVFTITVDPSRVTSIYSDADIQAVLLDAFKQRKEIQVFDYKETLYERLSVKDNVKFYKRWFNCPMPLAEILVMFHLQHCLEKPIATCTASELRRVYFAKQYMSAGGSAMVFVEPLHGVGTLTMDTFFLLLKKIREEGIPVCILVTNMEHAILVSEEAYRLQESGLYPIEIEADKPEEAEKENTVQFATHNLSKIPAKIEDKVILFDPMEIDYIESQEGKAYIVINEDYFILDSTLTNIEKQLVMYGFFRCHRSYIVNLQKVREIITWSKNTYALRIDNKTQSTIPLSRTKIQEIQEIFSLK